jgi:phosphoglycolate phosphatase
MSQAASASSLSSNEPAADLTALSGSDRGGPRYRLLIFDLDGTLIDSAPDLCTALQLALGERGLPVPDLATTRRLVGEGQRVLIERALGWAGLDPDTPGLVEEVLPRFRLHYSEHLCEKTSVYPGVEAALRTLPRPQAVATNKPGAWARRLVEHLQLGGSLSWVLGEDDVGARKPDPKLLLHIAALAGVRPEETLMIGDSRIDWRAAAAAGTDLALCTWGYGDAATLAEARAAQSAEPGTGSGAQPAPRRGTPQRPYLLDSIEQLFACLEG